VYQALVLFVIWTCWCAAVARAAPPSADAQACVAASTQGQTDRDEGRLLAAREQLLACTREVCPSIVKKSCGSWLAELAGRIPSVVVRVHDAGQHDVADARVTLDGRPIALDGRPVALDPGTHTLRVQASAGPSAVRSESVEEPRVATERSFLLAEREQGRLLIVELPAQSAAPAPARSAASASAPERAEPEPALASNPSVEQRSPRAPARFSVPSAAWVLGGLGVGGVVTFAALRSKAANDLRELEQSCSPGCAKHESEAGNRKTLAADVSLGIGVAALAGAGVWTLGSWLSDRHDAPTPARAAQLSLVPTRGGAFAALAARY